MKKTEQKPMKRIANGTPVKWTSQAAGSAKEKKGTTLCFVGERVALRDALRAIGKPEISALIGYSGCVFTPVYVVEVPRNGKKGPLPPAYYKPLASVLEKQNPRAKRA